MAPFRPSGFAERLSGLDREEFAGFLADLWEGRGRDAYIEDGVLIEGDGTRLLVHRAPRWRPSVLPATDGREVDGIVTNLRVDDGPDGVRVIDAEDLREMVLYAVDRPTREALSERYFNGAPPIPEENERERVSAQFGPSAVGVVGVLLIAAAVVAAGGFGGVSPTLDPSSGNSTLTAGRPGIAASPTAVPAPTATPSSAASSGRSAGAGTPVESSPQSGSKTPSGSMLIALDRSGTQYDDDPYPVELETGGGIVIIEFSHPIDEGYFALWIDEGNGTGRFLVGGQGAGSVRILVDLPPGRHTLFVRAIGEWHLRVRASRPPATLGLTQEEAATMFAGPIEFRGMTNVSVRGLDPNATYNAVLVDEEGIPRNVLVDRDGPTGTVSTVVQYNDTGFVRMSSTGRWVVVLRPSGRDDPEPLVEVLRDGAADRWPRRNSSASRRDR